MKDEPVKEMSTQSGFIHRGRLLVFHRVLYSMNAEVIVSQYLRSEFDPQQKREIQNSWDRSEAIPSLCKINSRRVLH